jgi:hypothetical protein
MGQAGSKEGRKMIIYTMEQGTPEWDAIRLGKFTASIFDALMPTSRQKPDKWNDTQMGIIYQVAAERMAIPDEDDIEYPSRDMKRGILVEPEARAAYEMETQNLVNQVGFIEHSDWIGCSPDGLIGESGGYEGKAPKSKTHIKYRNEPTELEETYLYQVQGNLWISGREWWDLCSYDSRFVDEGKQLLILHIKRDEEKISALASRLELAIEKCKEIMLA